MKKIRDATIAIFMLALAYFTINVTVALNKEPPAQCASIDSLLSME